MDDTVATNILVFGRGLVRDRTGFQLTEASDARVEALLSYVRQHSLAFRARRGTVVFSGGWAGAAMRAYAPPKAFREGNLMLDRAKVTDIDGRDFLDYVDAFAEIESDSTLENVLRIQEAGYFVNVNFTAANPIGLVAHPEHLPRIAYLVRKVFGLPADAITTIAALGDDDSGLYSERTLLLLTRLAFLGVHSFPQLRSRHQVLTAVSHTVRPDRAHARSRPRS